jgi:hypothetical protein
VSGTRHFEPRWYGKRPVPVPAPTLTGTDWSEGGGGPRLSQQTGVSALCRLFGLHPTNLGHHAEMVRGFNRVAQQQRQIQFVGYPVRRSHIDNPVNW